jgi:hypothetical protein
VDAAAAFSSGDNPYSVTARHVWPPQQQRPGVGAGGAGGAGGVLSSCSHSFMLYSLLTIVG